MWKATIEPLAQQDIRGAIAYYQANAPEVIPRFRETLRATIHIIREYPYMAAERHPNRRHRATKVFPYHVWYALDKNTRVIHVLRVIHVRRDFDPLLIDR